MTMSRSDRFVWEENDIVRTTKVRVYLDIEGSAPEPIGACHESCEDECPDDIDGMDVTTDGGWWDNDEVQSQPCIVCGN